MYRLVFKFPNFIIVEYLYLVRFGIMGALDCRELRLKLLDYVSVLSSVTLLLILFIN